MFFLLPFQVVIVLKAIQYEPVTMGSYVYPDWGNALGWLMVVFPVIMIPGGFIYHLLFKDNRGVSAEFHENDTILYYFSSTFCTL